MRKRKHPRPNQRRKINFRSNRRRSFLNFAIAVAALMAISLIASNYATKADSSLPKTDTASTKAVDTSKASRAPASLPATH